MYFWCVFNFIFGVNGVGLGYIRYFYYSFVGSYFIVFWGGGIVVNVELG